MSGTSIIAKFSMSLKEMSPSLKWMQLMKISAHFSSFPLMCRTLSAFWSGLLSAIASNVIQNDSIEPRKSEKLNLLEPITHITYMIKLKKQTFLFC